ncbi:hypothetical protein IFM89_008083 [Coptis chinensis]|uniref:Uncharacterized protein n=1 Tax=Coptis chinensis TaxID=261450 RepID=A0A835M9D1_9MAGN|nr:hypothetical protein IFM89_008083 [Coptis chinensis]
MFPNAKIVVLISNTASRTSKEGCMGVRQRYMFGCGSHPSRLCIGTYSSSTP